ncbi:MAG: cytochrome b/b6 domain-containing protein [Pseudomonadota bacterium]
MSFLNTKQGYGLVSKFFHWFVFVVVMTQLYLINRRRFFSDDMPEKLQYILLHKSVGGIFLLVMPIILIWRLFNQYPPLPPTVAAWERVSARITHWLLNAVLMMMPVSGYLMSNYGGSIVKIFDWALPSLVAPNKAASGFWFEVHGLCALLLIVLVTLHIAGGFKHLFKDKYNVFKRMY